LAEQFGEQEMPDILTVSSRHIAIGMRATNTSSVEPEIVFSAMKRVLGEALLARRSDFMLRGAQYKEVAYNKLLMAQLCDTACLIQNLIIR